MSYPYPQDRRREQREKGDEPYQDAAQEYGEQRAELEREASIPHDERERRTRRDAEQDAAERFEEIGDEVADERDDASG